ncbi:MAG: ribulose-phosphate 3-epimerase [Planctomycetota bacterium]|jgi:ribulose-phosphate 3-epimerase|nr:ribulose-phosphate 3-epimerase [Planctomycetota bacterium]
MSRRVKIAPSLLAADPLRLGDEIAGIEAAGADLLHFDVMDGHFVPNISLGIGLLENVRRATRLPLDVHLMLDNPERHLAAFAAAGADGITVHLEVHPEPEAILERIGELGKTRGLAVNPDMPIERLAGRLARVDRLLVMSVFPGFGGQSFIPESLDRLARARRLLAAEGRPEAELQVDGGVGPGNCAALAAAGADCLVAGTAVFRAPDPAAAIAALRGG